MSYLDTLDPVQRAHWEHYGRLLALRDVARQYALNPSPYRLGVLRETVLTEMTAERLHRDEQQADQAAEQEA